MILIAAVVMALPLSAQNRKEKIQMLDSLTSAMSTTIDDIKGQIKDNDESYRAVDDALKEKIDKLAGEVEKLEKAVSQHLSKIHTLEKTIEDTIVYLVQQYYGAKRWTDQLKYVLDSAKVEPLMKRYYSNGYTPEKIKKSLIAVDDDEVAMGKVTRVDADMYVVYVKRTGEGFKIDWQATTGTDDYSFEAFMAEKIGEAAYVLKTSEAGKKLYEVVKDGYTHDVIVQVRYEKKNIKSGYTRMFPMIVGFVKEGWSLE